MLERHLISNLLKALLFRSYIIKVADITKKLVFVRTNDDDCGYLVRRPNNVENYWHVYKDKDGYKELNILNFFCWSRTAAETIYVDSIHVSTVTDNFLKLICNISSIPGWQLYNVTFEYNDLYTRLTGIWLLRRSVTHTHVRARTRTHPH